jgi:hypothetical protein
MAVRVTPANSFPKTIGDKNLDLVADTIKVMLSTSLFQTDVEWDAWAASTSYVVGNIVRPGTPDGHAFECTVAGTSGTCEPTFNESPGGGSTTNDNGVEWTDLGILPPLREVVNIGAILTATTWAASFNYSVGDFVIPTTPNGHVYEATADAGSSGTCEPTFPTDRTTVVDGGITWTDRGMNPGGAEVTGTGYVAGGAAIGTKTLTNSDATARRTFWDGVDVTWATSTITARTGSIYVSGTIDGIINPLIGYILFNDTPADVGSVAADFIIKWNAEGIMRLRATLT